jgi:hypothetical protein
MALNFPFPLDVTSPVPFTISVDEAFVEESREKASKYRPSIDLVDGSNDNWIQGPPRANMTALADYWTDEYDWFAQQDIFNEKFDHFAINVPETEAWPHKVPLHYIHERAEDEDALPLLLLHGWPSTSWEWEKVIHPLVSPSGSSSSGYHVVAPDLPGFGFSPAPRHANFDPVTMASVMDAFMAELGYDRYGVISTDLGWWIAMFMMDVVPKGRIAGHWCDFFPVRPNGTDLERYQNNQTTEEETAFLDSMTAWDAMHTGYQHVQTQQPLAVGQAFSDSPVGFAGWVWQTLESVSDRYPYTFDEIVTTSFLVFIQGTYGNLRYYTEFFNVC